MNRLAPLALGACLALGAVAVRAQDRLTCASDLDCTNRLPFCLEGLCSLPICDGDGDCPNGLGCVSGVCAKVECTSASDCRIGRACFEHACVGCNENRDCGENGVCSNHECAAAGCTKDVHCAADQKCEGNVCVPACGEREIFVAREDEGNLCTACIRLGDTGTFPHFGGWPCVNDGDCPGARQFCAQGYCIDRCKRRADKLDDERFQALRSLPFVVGAIDPAPCPRCTHSFLALGIRGILERARVDRPVHLALLDDAGATIADFGTFAPQEGSWAAIPAALTPELRADIPAEGACGYRLAIAEGGLAPAAKQGKTAKKAKAAPAATSTGARLGICLEPWAKPN